MNKIEVLGTLEECIENNKGLIHKGCNKYKKFAAQKRIEYDDLYQIGSIALMKAYKVFDPNMDNGMGGKMKFSSLAVVSIYRELVRYITRYNDGMKVSSKVRDIEFLIYKKGWENLSDEEIAEKTGRTVKFIKSFRNHPNLKNGLLSLDKTNFDDGEDDFHQINGVDIKNDEVLAIKEAINTLKEKQRQCLIMHMNGYSQKEIGKHFGFTQVQASRLISEAKEKIKKQLEMV